LPTNLCMFPMRGQSNESCRERYKSSSNDVHNRHARCLDLVHLNKVIVGLIWFSVSSVYLTLLSLHLPICFAQIGKSKHTPWTLPNFLRLPVCSTWDFDPSSIQFQVIFTGLIRKPKELPLESDFEDEATDPAAELAPLVLPSANNLINFPNQGANERQQDAFK